MCLCVNVNSHHKLLSPKVPKLLLLNYYQSCESFKRMWMFGNLMKVKCTFLHAITLSHYELKFSMNVVDS